MKKKVNRKSKKQKDKKDKLQNQIDDWFQDMSALF